ncbi:MAG: hypothetical protein V2A73_09240, partial [Pseudomonadota bacterium]
RQYNHTASHPSAPYHVRTLDRLDLSPGGPIDAFPGTSYSAPTVAGLAGILLALNPGLKTEGALTFPQRVRNVLYYTADPLNELRADGGGPRINALRAIQRVTGDANLDGLVTDDDYFIVKDIVDKVAGALAAADCTEVSAKCRADLNGDGQVDQLDADRVLLVVDCQDRDVGGDTRFAALQAALPSASRMRCRPGRRTVPKSPSGYHGIGDFGDSGIHRRRW